MFRLGRSIKYVRHSKLRTYKLYQTPFFSTAPFIYQQMSDKKPDNDFIASLISNKNWLTSKIERLEIPTVDDMNAKLEQIYPEFTKPFTQLHENYQKLWDYLTMEEFRKIVDDLVREQKDSTVYPEILRDATVREGNALSAQEQEFISARKQKQKESFAKFIGVEPSEVDVRDIPVIGIASSGGGYRAMIGLTGYLEAMKQSGVMDCVMYFSGVSGSCWTMALYYHPFTQGDPFRLERHLESHVGTHWANVSNFLHLLTSSPNKSLLLQGAIQRYYQQSGDISLVDLFGILMGGTLLTKKPPTSSLDDTKKAMRLTAQADYLKDGAQPLPIYCVVRHDIALGKTLEDRLKGLKKKYAKEKDAHLKQEIEKLKAEKEEAEEKRKDAYQWFEFTPFDMGCEELEAWIPMWSFGRKFERGRDTEKLPEQTLDILIGTFGSAFAASLVHFYQEIRSFLPAGSLDKIDDVIKRYEESMSSYHPISPSSFPNPFYKLSEGFKTQDGKEMKRPAALVDSQELYLMDAGMDNNIPFYPLLREGRDVDIVLAFDLSANIQTSTHFDRAESYIKQRGIKGWPTHAGWPKQHDNSEDKYPLGTCTVFESDAKEDVTTANQADVVSKKRSITLAYFPFIVNKAYDADFDPQTEEFCSTWNFVYTPEQVKKVTGLARANWDDNIDKMKALLKKTWERKRDERVE